MRNAIACRRGFTIIEVLVSIAILGVVTTIGVRSFVLLTTHWADTRSMVELDGFLDNVFESIENDVVDMLSAELSGVAVRGYDQFSESGGFNQASDNDDRIVFPIQDATHNSTLHTANLVQYRVLRSDTEPNILYRSIGSLGTADPANVRTPVESKLNIVRFDITYATGDDETPWVASWSADEHPKAIRVSLTVSDPDNPFRQISRKEVYSVHVR